MISIAGAVTVVVHLIVGGLIFYLLNWLIDYCQVPEPFRKIAKIVLAIVAVLVIIGILLSQVGGQPLFRP